MNISVLLEAARAVIANWSSGDLAAAVRDLEAAVQENTLQAAEVFGQKKKRLQCPACGNTEEFRYAEYVTETRSIDGIDDGTLYIHSDTEICTEDPGDVRRLECRKCLAELAIPEGLELDFVVGGD